MNYSQLLLLVCFMIMANILIFRKMKTFFDVIFLGLHLIIIIFPSTNCTSAAIMDTMWRNFPYIHSLIKISFARKILRLLFSRQKLNKTHNFGKFQLMSNFRVNYTRHFRIKAEIINNTNFTVF